MERWKGTSRRRKLVLLGIVAALVAAGVGVAAWLVSGSGSGAAHVANGLQPLVLTPDGGTSGGTGGRLAPGQSGSLYFRVSNPNTITVYIHETEADGPVVVDAGHAGACPASNFTVPTQTAQSIEVAPGSNVAVEITTAVSMSPNASPGCQGASIEAPVTVSASTSP